MERIACREVILSTKAYLTIVVETFARVSTETGGILLGQRDGEVWHVIEAIDAGINATFRPAYFEYDTVYVNHVANHVARLYQAPLELLGLWHRHPGSMDIFSSTDGQTNATYAARHPAGSISALVNLDPDFRLTMYHVAPPLHYSRVPIRWGDSHVPQHFLNLKAVDDVLPPPLRHPYQGEEPTAGPPITTTADAPHAAPVSAFLSSVRDGFRAAGHSWARRRQAQASAEPPGVQRALEPADMTASPAGPSEPVLPTRPDTTTSLDLLDSEMGYIDEQRDYECTLRAQDEKVLVTMKYLHAMPYFPPEIECVLGIRPDGQAYVIINGHERPYTAGAIRAYVDEAVRRAMEPDSSRRETR